MLDALKYPLLSKFVHVRESLGKYGLLVLAILKSKRFGRHSLSILMDHVVYLEGKKR